MYHVLYIVYYISYIMYHVLYVGGAYVGIDVSLGAGVVNVILPYNFFPIFPQLTHYLHLFYTLPRETVWHLDKNLTPET